MAGSFLESVDVTLSWSVEEFLSLAETNSELWKICLEDPEEPTKICHFSFVPPNVALDVLGQFMMNGR